MPATMSTDELDRIIRDTPLNVAQIINVLAFQVEGRAKMFCPVDTGAMRNSCYTDAATMSEPTAIVGYTVEYAPHVEYGTYKMGAQPSLGPALETIMSQFNSGQTWKDLTK